MRFIWIGVLVMSFLARAEEPTPLKRLTEPLAVVQKAIEGKSQAAIFKGIFPLEPLPLAGDVRTQLFRVEGLLRLYEKFGEPEEAITKAAERVKALEDAIGEFGERQEAKDFGIAIKLGDSYPKAQAILESEEAEARKVFFKFLEDEEFSSHQGGKSGWDKLAEDLRAIEFKSYKKDRSQLLGELAQFLANVHHDLRTEEYDFDLIEDGLHEFRRDLRWFLIDMHSFNGILVLDDSRCPIPDLAPLVKDPKFKDSPFAKIEGNERELLPCKISSCLFHGMSKAVRDLGYVKDVGLAEEEFLTAALKKAGVEKPRKTAEALARTHEDWKKALAHFPDAKSPSDVGRSAAKEVLDLKLIKRIEEELRACQGF